MVALKERLDASIGKMPEWTLHDLRRTAATGMGDLGVEPHVIEAALNHVNGSKAGSRRNLQSQPLRKGSA